MAKVEVSSRSENQQKLEKSSSSLSGRFHDDDKGHFAITIGAPMQEVYAFFRDFSNLPRFMKDLKEIKILSPKKSHWVVEVKGGFRAEWDAEITAERSGEMIAWKSIEGSEVHTEGGIWFSPAAEGRGTVVSLMHNYSLPGGKLTEWLTGFTGDHPQELANVNLRRLKGLIETGVIATTEGQPSGREADAKTVKH